MIVTSIEHLREAVRLNTCGWYTVRAACDWFNQTTGANFYVTRNANGTVTVGDGNDLPRPWDMIGTPKEIVEWFIS